MLSMYVHSCSAIILLGAEADSKHQIPKRKPKLLKGNEENAKPPGVPKKFVTFSLHDSRSIESAYQKLADEYDDPNRDVRQKGEDDTSGSQSPSSSGKQPNTSIDEAGQDTHAGGKVKVPVQEDFLFDVDIEQRELSPVYWLGPIYEVRRGSWFYQEGSTLRPCEENLAFQLEEGYLKIMPFRYPKASSFCYMLLISSCDWIVHVSVRTEEDQLLTHR